MEQKLTNEALGEAGAKLVSVHLTYLGIKHGIVHGADEDIIAFIAGKWRGIQVKTSLDGSHFSSGGSWAANISVTGKELARKKMFTEYKVEAFAFCCLRDPYPNYIAIEAMSDSISLVFSRARRDLSFEELLRRWEC